MTIKPLAYINVEERKLEWAEPMTWNTPTIAKMDKIPLYLHPVKELTDEEFAGIGLHLFRIGEATSIKDGIRLVKLIFELANIRKAQEK